MQRINTTTETQATQRQTMDINPNELYIVIDFKTSRVVYTTTWANRNQARRVAERRNQDYGAVRYGCSLTSSRHSK